MEAAAERSNMLCAYERVVKHQGAPGVERSGISADRDLAYRPKRLAAKGLRKKL